MFKLIKWLVFILLGIILLVFMLSNRELISINLYPFPYVIDISLFIVLIATFLFGLLCGEVIGRLRSLRLRYRLRESELRVNALKKEISANKAASRITNKLIAA